VKLRDKSYRLTPHPPLRPVAKSSRDENIARAGALLDATNTNASADNDNAAHICLHCGGRMITVETFERGQTPRHPPSGPVPAIRIDTS